MNRITGSYIGVVARCKAAALLQENVYPTSKYAEIGRAAHAYYELGIEQHDTFLEVPRFKRPEERTFSEVRHEWRYGWDFIDNKFVTIPKGDGERDYSAYPKERWVMASVDAAWVDGDTLVIEDLKTGAPVDPLCEQVVFIAHCAVMSSGHTGPVVLQTLNATRYGYKTNPKLAGTVELKREELTVGGLAVAFERMVACYVREAAAMADADEAAKQAAATPGKHCFNCRARAHCNAYRAKATPKGLEYLDKIIAWQEQNGEEQGERDESGGQDNHGPDTGGDAGSGTSERETPDSHEAQ